MGKGQERYQESNPYDIARAKRRGIILVITAKQRKTHRTEETIEETQHGPHSPSSYACPPRIQFALTFHRFILSLPGEMKCWASSRLLRERLAPGPSSQLLVLILDL